MGRVSAVGSVKLSTVFPTTKGISTIEAKLGIENIGVLTSRCFNLGSLKKQ